LNENDLIDQAAEADAIIAATDSYTPIVFKSLPNLKLIARCGVGIDSVNLAAATQAGVIVTNVPEAMTDAVADYCFGLLLSAARHIHTGYACMKSNGWNEFPGIELNGKRLGLVGFGRIGQAVAKRAFGFGLRVAAYDPLLESMMLSKKAPATLVELASHIEWLSFDSLLESSDFVSIHAPNSPENKHLFSTDAFRKMQPHTLLINTSRGGLIDTNALIEALNTGAIGGAAIDVYEVEPLPVNHPLRSTPKLLLTPHNAFNSFEASRRMSQGCFDPIYVLLNKIPPSVICNPQVLTQKNLRASLTI
jgi:phosphoglycerate dehydrogenase-like enzyme